MDLLILDLATMSYRFESDRSVLVVAAPGWPELVRAQMPAGVSDREAVFLGLDAVLASGRVPTSSGWAAVGLYNPLSAEVAVDPIPDTISFWDGQPIEIPAGGLAASLRDGILVLDDGRQIMPTEETALAVQRALAAHRL